MLFNLAGLPLDSLAVLNKGRKLLPTEVVTCDPSQEDVFLTVAHKNGLLGGAPLPVRVFIWRLASAYSPYLRCRDVST